MPTELAKANEQQLLATMSDGGKVQVLHPKSIEVNLNLCTYDKKMYTQTYHACMHGSPLQNPLAQLKHLINCCTSSYQVYSYQSTPLSTACLQHACNKST